MEILIEARGVEQSASLLERLARKGENGRLLLPSLIDQLLEAERDRFAGGVRWKRATPGTRSKDRRAGRDPRLLVNTGRLMDSLTRRGGRDQVLEIRPNELKFGTRVYYAVFHQKGRGVARRAPVGLTRKQKTSLIDELRKLLLED